MGSSKGERLGEITQEYDNFILDISSVPLPSESQPPVQGRTAGAGSSDRCQTGASGRAHTPTEEDQHKPSIRDFSSLTSQNRILKKAWLSTVSSGHPKREDPGVASRQPKNPSPPSSRRQTSHNQNHTQQGKTHSVSPGKSTCGRQETQSESSAILSATEGTLKEARPHSQLAARADKSGKTPISVKMTSKAKPQVLTKKISLSSGSSEEGKKSAVRRRRLLGRPVRPSGSNSRHAHHRPGGTQEELSEQDEEEPEERRMRKSQTDEPAVDEARLSGGQTQNRALKTGVSGKHPKSSSRIRRQEGERSAAPKEGRGEIHAQENGHEHRMDQSRPHRGRKETVCESALQDSSSPRPAGHHSSSSKPARHHNSATRLDASAHDPEHMEEEEVCTQKNLQERKQGRPGTKGKDSNRRPVAKSKVLSRPPARPDTTHQMEIPRTKPKTQEGETEICQQRLQHKPKLMPGTREGKQATSGTAVGKTTPGKQPTSSGIPGRLDPSRAASKAAQHRGQAQHSAQEPILKKSQIKQEPDPDPLPKTVLTKQQLQEKKRRLALKRKMLEHLCRPGRNLDVCRLEAEEDMYPHQPVPKVKVKVRSMAARETTRGQHIKSDILVGPFTASGIISELVARRYRPRVRDSQQCLHADPSELTADTHTAKQDRKGVKNEASASRSAAAAAADKGMHRPGPRERRDGDDDQHPVVEKLERKQRQNNEDDTANRDSVSDSSEDSETSHEDTAVNTKSGDELERKLREKLLRCLEAKRTQPGHHRSRAGLHTAEIAHSPSKSFQDKSETTHGRPETTRDNPETTHSTTETADDGPETANDTAETTQDSAEMPAGDDPETAGNSAETLRDISETTQNRLETAQDRSETTQDISETTQDRPSSKAEVSVPSPAAGP